MGTPLANHFITDPENEDSREKKSKIKADEPRQSDLNHGIVPEPLSDEAAGCRALPDVVTGLSGS